MIITLDASCMEQRKTAHAYLKEQLQFPEYYGMNLDALYDCLGALNDTQVTFINTEDAPAYYKKVARVFRDATRRNAGLTIIPEPLPGEDDEDEEE